MGKITVRELYNDVADIGVEDFKSYEKIRHVEIVPRRMVEMIIEKCENEKTWAIATLQENAYLDGRLDSLDVIENYINHLLREFEEDK